jgi:hypothetical protein
MALLKSSFQFSNSVKANFSCALRFVASFGYKTISFCDNPKLIIISIAKAIVYQQLLHGHLHVVLKICESQGTSRPHDAHKTTSAKQ